MRNLLAGQQHRIMRLNTIDADFRDKSFALKALDQPPLTSDSREGNHSWSLYGSSGSQTIQSTGIVAANSMDFYGTEGPPNIVGTSRYEFSEWVQYYAATGTITFTNGTVQKVSGQVVGMCSGMEVWSGTMKDPNGNPHDTPAQSKYYIALSLRRQAPSTSAGPQFHLAILPIQRAYDSGDVGSNTLLVIDDSTGALLSQQDLPLSSDPHNNMSCIYEISKLVNAGDFLKVQVISQLALTNPNSSANPVAGGAVCGIGFLDNAS